MMENSRVNLVKYGKREKWSTTSGQRSRIHRGQVVSFFADDTDDSRRFFLDSESSLHISCVDILGSTEMITLNEAIDEFSKIRSAYQRRMIKMVVVAASEMARIRNLEESIAPGRVICPCYSKEKIVTRGSVGGK
jgi:hypothetical protein